MDHDPDSAGCTVEISGPAAGELFPLIEDGLTERELRQLGARIESELAPGR